MPSKFKLFSETGTNVFNDVEWSDLVERQTGFLPNTVASSKAINTAVKTASLVTVALMNVVTKSQSETVGIDSSVVDIQSYISAGLATIVENAIEEHGGGQGLTPITRADWEKLTEAEAEGKAYAITDDFYGENATDILLANGIGKVSAWKDNAKSIVAIDCAEGNKGTRLQITHTADGSTIDVFRFDGDVMTHLGSIVPEFNVIGTLAANATTLVLADNRITTNSTVDIYPEDVTIAPTSVVVDNGKITLTFDAQTEAVRIKAVVK